MSELIERLAQAYSSSGIATICHNGSQLARLPRWLLLGDREPYFGVVAGLGTSAGEPDRAPPFLRKKRTALSAYSKDPTGIYLSMVE